MENIHPSRQKKDSRGWTTWKTVFVIVNFILALIAGHYASDSFLGIWELTVFWFVMLPSIFIFGCWHEKFLEEQAQFRANEYERKRKMREAEAMKWLYTFDPNEKK